MFKKIYIEITNVCNLNCSFCVKTKRDKQFMTYEQFKLIINKIKPYTNYIYMHVMGEPLLHKDINKFILYAKSRGIFVNITTNGRLIDNLKELPRQINISLQSYYNEIDKLNNLYKKCDCLADQKVFINYQIWISCSPTFTCRALKDHIAILVDGTVVPCCMDSEGLIELGNIYNASINDIMNNPTYKCILNGFNNNKKISKLCKNSY